MGYCYVLKPYIDSAKRFDQRNQLHHNTLPGITTLFCSAPVAATIPYTRVIVVHIAGYNIMIAARCHHNGYIAFETPHYNILEQLLDTFFKID